MKFKKELQWNGNETLDYTVTGFNSDSSMDKYNKPIYVKKDFFKQFSSSEYVDRTVIAYTENVYGVFYDLEDNRQYRNLLYGGTLADINITAPSHMNDRLALTDGELNEQGECLIHRLSAKEYGYKIGDYITYTDIDGNKLGKLKISGFFGFINDPVSDEYGFVFWVGSNPFFRNMVNIQRMIITDFDTVYYAYENDEDSSTFTEQHEFNKYIAWYILNDGVNYDAFVNETENHDIDDTLDFYWDYGKYEREVHTPMQTINIANIFTIITLSLSGIIMTILTVYILNERRYETGILYSLGATKLTLIMNYLYEMIFYMVFIAFLSIFTGKFILNLTLANARFLSDLNINYTPGFPFLLRLFGFSMIIIFVSVIFVSAFILRSSPSKLISSGRQ
ncbi:MAG: ABC transporter permease [Eubacteriales bacterium]|nr:ABC transporter permease [Eubacteriales bacterium]